MKKPVLALLFLLLPAVLVLLWLSLGKSERGQATNDSQSMTGLAQKKAEAEVATPVPLELAKPEKQPELVPSAPTPASEDRRAVAESGSGRRILGRVLFPLGAPADDSLRVLALAEAQPLRQIYGTGGVLADLAEGKKERALGTASVGADGSFSLALAAAGDVVLVLDGRFLYSAQPYRAAAGDDAPALAAELGGCLSGRVRLPKLGVAFEGITAQLGPDAQNFSADSLSSNTLFQRRATLDADGRFELRALPCGTPHALEVEAKDYADEKVPGLEFEPGRVREVEVALLVGATLRGVVRDEAGANLAEAEVKAAESGMFGFPGDELAKTKCDANGAFALEHVAPGKCILLAKKAGQLEGEPQKLELADGEVRDGLVITLGKGASISGRVELADGSAAEGALVKVSFDPEAMVGMGALNAARGGSGESKSAADGRFEVAGLGKGPFVVVATLERGEGDAKQKWLARSKSVAPGTNDMLLRLAAPSTIAGRVRDAAGAPVAAFHVRTAQASGSLFMSVESRGQDFQDAEGKFALRNLEPGSWTIEASAKGFGPMTPLELALPRADETPLELVLAPAASVAGKVVDPSGAPVSGAKVTLQVENLQRLARLRGDIQAPEATSLEDGTFVLEGLGSGTSSIFAAREGFAASEPASVETRSGERSEGVVLALRKGARVLGEVYGKDGKPASGAQIIAQEQGSWMPSMKRSDGEGRFEFENLSPGAWTISAILVGGDVDLAGGASDATASLMDNMRFTMVTLEDGEEERVVLGAPPKDPVLLQGKVEHAGEPVVGGMLSFMAEGAKGMEALKIASVGADGHYQVELSQPGKYLVTVQINKSGAAFQQDSVVFRETVPETKQHTLDFELPLGAVRGLVRGADGNALSGTRVTISTDGGLEAGTMLGGHYAEASTDEHGRYSFEFLRPGQYAVAAGGALFGGAFGGKTTAGRVVRDGLHVAEGKAVEGVDFELSEPGNIHGRVVSATGVGIKDAAIFVRDSQGRPLDRLSMITSSADGSFAYEGLAEGEYQVSARGKGQASAESAPVRVKKGENANVEIVLYPGTTLVIEIVGDDGEPLHAQLTVTDARGREMQGLLGMSEMAASFSEGFSSSTERVGPLPPGTYTVTATTDDGKKSTKPVTLDGQPERKLKIHLR
ncbi:MAG: hypothetical protein EXS08_02050 [Planctomycetes bacterium]|nr:hypothetical protein [Planctomycetota bacterium]